MGCRKHEMEYPPHRNWLQWQWMRFRNRASFIQWPWSHNERGISPSNPWHPDVDESQTAIQFLEDFGTRPLEPETELIDPEKVGDAIADEKEKQEEKIQAAIEFQDFLDKTSEDGVEHD